MVQPAGSSVNIGHHPIAEGVSIERLSENLQLARNKTRSLTTSPHEYVIGAATHALFLKHWVIGNEIYGKREKVLCHIAAFGVVIEKVETFLAALRAVTGTETGYAQIIAKPKGWGDRWKAWIPHVYVVATRGYPDHLENYGWLQTPPKLSEPACIEVGRLFEKLLELPRLKLATKRLNSAFLRRAEEDSILDLTIALESLLVSDSKGEITYRLAMRLAAVCNIEPFEDYSPDKIFWACKRIYDYRSAVVHGGRQIDKSRVIKMSEQKDIPAVQLGLSLLRHVVRFFCKHPQYIEHSSLDKYLTSRY